LISASKNFGTVRSYVAWKDVEISEAVLKFGRTTVYTRGKIFSICLDIWIRYDRTGQSAFFRDQFLIEPDLRQFTKFVSGGDSGSLVVDAQQNAIGLIFAGMSELLESLGVPSDAKAVAGSDPAIDRPKRIESYGVANPISEVLDRLKCWFDRVQLVLQTTRFLNPCSLIQCKHGCPRAGCVREGLRVACQRRASGQGAL
jgi:hypothetical protein